MNARILVIEDTPVNLELVTALLEAAGHTVLSATSAEPGLALARRELPDLILMDINLPGMDGLAATRALKADPATRAIPVVAAHRQRDARRRAAGQGSRLPRLHDQAAGHAKLRPADRRAARREPDQSKCK